MQEKTDARQGAAAKQNENGAARADTNQ